MERLVDQYLSLMCACPPTTVDLVLSVVTVLLAITFPEVGDTLSGARSAAKLVHTTRPHVCKGDKSENNYIIHLNKLEFVIEYTIFQFKECFFF